MLRVRLSTPIGELSAFVRGEALVALDLPETPGPAAPGLPRRFPGETVEEGNEPGAPVNPRLARKVVITTALATVVFAIVYLAQTRGLLSLDSLPFYNTMPSPK